jgi:hypothetical protein
MFSEVKVNFTLEQLMKAQRVSRGIALLSFLTTVLDVGGWSVPHPSHFTPWMETQYPRCRRLGGPQGQSGQVHKILPLQGFDSWTVQPVWRVFKDDRILGYIYHLVAYWWLHLMCIMSDILIEYCICFLRWKKGFWFTVNIGCIETADCSSAVLHALAKIIVLFSKGGRRGFGVKITSCFIYICIYMYTLTVTVV